METITPEVVQNDTPESNPLTLVIRENHLELESAQFLTTTFEPLLKQAQEWANKVSTIHVTDASQTREMKLARETRLALREIRIKTDKARKSLKDESLRRSRAIDGAANIIKFLVEPLEEKLEAQEKFVEIQEAKRKEDLKQARLALLAPYNTDVSFYSLDEMPEPVFVQLLESTRALFEQKQKEAQRIEAERVEAERKRVEEQEKIRLENERLRREAAELAEQQKIEREKAEKTLREAQEAARKEKEAAEAAAALKLAEERRKAKEEAERMAAQQRIEREAAEKKAAQERQALMAERAAFEKKAALERAADQERARKEREEREKLVAEIAAKQKRELEAIRLAEEEKKKAAHAPEKQKLMMFAKEVRNLSPQIPVLTSPEGKAVGIQLHSQVEKFALWIEKQAAAL